MSPRQSAIEAISPSFDRMKRQLFQPFRFRRWWRLGVMALVTGEFASGGWGGSNVNMPAGGGGGGGEGNPGLGLLALDPTFDRILPYLPWILWGVAALVTLALVFSFIESVFRFLLLDSVLRDRTEIRAGWRRWQEKGGSYFLWQLALRGVLLAALGVCVGGPVYYAWRTGMLQQAQRYFGILLAGGLAVFFLLVVILLAGALVTLLARDFVLPIMAIEDVGVLEGWRRFLPLLASEKGTFAGYVLMKIVLSVGSAILFGFVNILLLLALLIPLGIAGAGILLVAAAANLAWNAYTISGAVLLGCAALGVILFAVGLAYVPGLVFFQAYPLQFLSGRLPALGAILNPPPEPPPVPAEPEGAPVAVA
jgi:hypothetical protein